MLQGRVFRGAHELGVVRNTIIRFVENYLKHVTAKNYENWFTNKKKVIAEIKRVPVLF